MKPSETKDESMQRADTQSPLGCSPPASSEAQPDHCRKVVQKVMTMKTMNREVQAAWLPPSAPDEFLCPWHHHHMSNSCTMSWTPPALFASASSLCQSPCEASLSFHVDVNPSFFLLHAAKVRSSCEEGPGQSALQSAYHNPKLDVTELKQNRTP